VLGTEATAGLLLERFTAQPPVGAWPRDKHLELLAPFLEQKTGLR